MISRNLITHGLAVSMLLGIMSCQIAQAQGAATQNTSSSGRYLPGSVNYDEHLTAPATAPRLRLSRQQGGVMDQGQTPPQQPPARLMNQTPTADFATTPPPPAATSKPIPAAIDSNMLILQQSLRTTIESCFGLIATGANSRHLTVQEELELRSELQQIINQNNAYAAKGHTQEQFQEIQQKLVVLQLHIYAYGTNTINR